MKVTHGKLYWTDKNKILKTYPYLTQDEECDVVVVGGGITGLITAYCLAKENMKVIVIEKNIIGYNSTAATTALLEYQIDVDLYKLSKMIGECNARKMFELCSQAIDEIEKIDKEMGRKGEFKRKDSLYYTTKMMHRGSLVKEYEARKKAGFPVEFVEKNDILEYNCAIRSKNQSGDIDPYKFTSCLAEYLDSMEQVSVYENTELASIKYGYDENICITNNNFKIKASKVIFCTGYETLKYLPSSNNLITLVKTFSIVTKPNVFLNKLDTNFTARDSCNPYHYLRFTRDSRIIYGGEDVKVTSKMSDEEYYKALSNDKYSKLMNSLNKLASKVGTVELEYAFSGTFADTVDTLPIVDEMPNMPNCFCNLGYGSNGILYSVIGANMLKDAVRGLYSKEMSFFALDRVK